jgi:hypothetical protein
MTLELKERLIELAPGKRVRIQFDSAVVSPANVEWFGGVMQRMASDGSRFESGQTMELGWSVVRLEAAHDGVLEIREPDFRSMPTKWLPGVSNSLVHMALHRDIVESVLPVDEMAIPGMRQSCIVCNETGDEPGFFMDRTEPRGQDSGWFFGCLHRGHNHETPANLLKMSLYELVVRRARAALPFLALPTGSMVALDVGRRSVSRYDIGLEPKPGSLLSRMPP